jgi:hypothetical protein
MLYDKIERLELRGNISNFTGSRGISELKLIRGPTRRQSNQSKKVEMAKYYYQWQILKPTGKRKAKMNFTMFAKTPNGIEEEDTLKGTTGIARLRGSAR